MESQIQMFKLAVLTRAPALSRPAARLVSLPTRPQPAYACNPRVQAVHDKLISILFSCMFTGNCKKKSSLKARTTSKEFTSKLSFSDRANC